MPITSGFSPFFTASQPHLFANKNLIAGLNTFTVPASASSNTSQFQVTARRVSTGADVSLRFVPINNTSFNIDVATATTGVNIYVNPIDTTS
jgi:hypothetical protein